MTTCCSSTPNQQNQLIQNSVKSNCCKWAEGHLTKSAKEASRQKLAEVEEQALQLLHDKRELGFSSSQTKKRAL